MTIRFMAGFGFFLDFLALVFFVYLISLLFKGKANSAKSNKNKLFAYVTPLEQTLNTLSAMAPNNMYLLVGLGNPGKKYEKNRHNIGFMAIDVFADEYGFPAFRSKFQGELSEKSVDGKKVILLKPQTYMNESGQSIQAAMKFYKLTADQVYIFHDELDLEPAKVRFKTGGGNAGHNGLKSTQQHLGTPDFHRIRMGIGHPGHKDRVHGYVLSDFAKADQDWLEKELQGLADHLPLLLDGNTEEYMSKVALNINS